ncbi:hypothetical protein FRB94_003048 [Tulasnella sp. JGI-2019a]|nr:hypothetical protein FRB94_003048 [Tulasnella sp. JGI-2019a]KAG9005299.1 hypothetical protein FRB93_009853 [Tulasnella sp. JGI-2019a]KAG9034868.1 hypothetical protein FRB95_012425 [Tulasnella sp. JGI-2019a]
MSAELQSPTSAQFSAGSTQTIEVNDCVFCTHGKEICDECDYDGREENDGFFGLKHSDRDPLEMPATIVNKAGDHQCKKHGTGNCSQCFNWKKMITKLQREAIKAGRRK